MYNYYKILGVENFASPDEIKTAYRKLSKKFHPDYNDGDKFFEEKFKELQAVYEILSDSLQKSSFDAALKKSLENTDQNFRASVNDATKSASSTQRVRRPSPYVFERGRLVKRKRF